MQALYSRLPEKNRRLYAGVEASKLGRGGVSYIARLFNCSRNTILRGIKELGEEEVLDKDRNREVGGGRSPVLEKQPDINDVFLQLLKEHTAGDPMNVQVKWTKMGYPLRSRNYMIELWMTQFVHGILSAALIIRERCRSLTNGFRMKKPVLRTCCDCVGQEGLFVHPVVHPKDG